jgi:hypothetical protein
MKKLNKLQINPARIMQNNELISLKGGDAPGGSPCCLCHLSDGTKKGFMFGATISTCSNLCSQAYFGGYGTWECLV